MAFGSASKGLQTYGVRVTGRLYGTVRLVITRLSLSSHDVRLYPLPVIRASFRPCWPQWLILVRDSQTVLAAATGTVRGFSGDRML
jgi:hypothetical protein